MKKVVFKNKILFVTAIMSLLLVLAACGGGSGMEDDSDDDASGDDESKEDGEWAGQKIKVMLIGEHEMEPSTDPKTGEEKPGIKELKKEFEDEHPGAKVDFVVAPWEGYAEKTQALITSGGADVFQLPGLADYAAQGVLEPLESYIEDDNYDLDKYIEGQINGWKSLGPDDDDEKIYGLPEEGDTRVTVYDKELFEQWGVEELSDEPTMDEILEKAKKMTGKNPETGEKNYGIWFRGDYDSAFTLVNAAESQDGQWGSGYDWDEVEFDFDSNEMKKGMEWLKDLSEYAPDGILSDQGDEQWLTEDNNVAIELEQSPAETLRDATATGTEDRFGITDDFSGSDGIGGMFGGSPISMAEDSDNKELAWEFIKFASSDFYQKYLWEESKILPVTKSAAELDYIKDYTMAVDSTEAMENSWTPRYPWASSQPRDILTNSIESVLSDEKEVDEALDGAQKDSTDWLDRR